MNITDDRVSALPTQDDSTLKLVDEEIRQLRKMLRPISPDETTFISIVRGMGEALMSRGIKNTVGSYVEPYIPTTATEAISPIEQATTGLHIGYRIGDPDSSRSPTARRIPWVLGYLLGSGIDFEAVKQFAFSSAPAFLTRPVSEQSAIFLNVINAFRSEVVQDTSLLAAVPELFGRPTSEQSAILLNIAKSALPALPLAVGLIGGYYWARNNEQKSIETENTVHELFDQGRTAYHDWFMRYFAHVIAIKTSEKVPTDFPAIMKFIENSGNREVAEEIVKAGQEDRLKDMEKLLQPFLDAADNQLIQDGSEIKVDPFQGMSEFLAEHFQPLTDHLRKNFPQLSGSNNPSPNIRIAQLELQRKAENELIKRVIKEYLAALPLMKEAAEAAQIDFMKCQWQPSGTNTQSPRTAFKVIGEVSNTMCLLMDSEDESASLTFVTANASQTRQIIKQGDRVFITQEGVISKNATPAKTVWDKAVKELDVLYEQEEKQGEKLQQTFIDALQVFGMGLRQVVTMRVTDEQLLKARLVEGRVNRLENAILKQMETMEEAYNNMSVKDKKSIETKHTKKKALADTKLAELHTDVNPFRYHRIQAGFINLNSAGLLESDFLKTFDRLSDAARREINILSMGNHPMDLVRFVKKCLVHHAPRAITLHQQVLIEQLRASPVNYEAALVEIARILQYQDDLIMGGRLTEKLLLEITQFRNIAINCQIQVASKQIKEIESGVSEGDQETLNQLAYIRECLNLTLGILKKHFGKFEVSKKTGEIQLYKATLPLEERRVILDALAELYVDLSMKCQRLLKSAAIADGSAVRRLTSIMEDLEDRIYSNLRSLPAGATFESKSRAAILERVGLRKFVSEESLSVEDQVAAMEAADSERDEPTTVVVETDEKEVTSGLADQTPELSREERQAAKKAAQKVGKEERRAERRAGRAPAAEESSKAGSSTISSAPESAPKNLSKPSTIPAESAETEDADQLLERLKRNVAQLTADLEKQKTALSTAEQKVSHLKSRPSDRKNESETQLRSYTDSAAYKALAVRKTYDQLIALHKEILTKLAGTSDADNSGFLLPQYRSEREPYRKKPAEYIELSESWRKEKAQQEWDETKKEIVSKPSSARFRLIRNEQITGVTSTVRPFIKPTGEYNANHQHLHDHVLQTRVKLQGGGEIVISEHFYLPTFETVTAESLRRNHEKDRIFGSFKKASEAGIGRNYADAYGIRIYHGNASHQDIERVRRLEAVRAIQSTTSGKARFTLDPAVTEMLQNAPNSDSGLSREALDDLQALVEFHKEKGCKLIFWGGDAPAGSASTPKKPPISHGKVIAGNADSEFCIVNPMATLPGNNGKPTPPKMTGTQIYYIAKRTEMEGVVKGQEFKHDGKKLTLTNENTTAPSNPVRTGRGAR